MHVFLAPVLALLAAAGADNLPEPETRVATRRVAISFSFTGHQVFLSGQLPSGADGAFAVMEGPSAGPARLMRKGRVVLFWMGVRQYELAHAPGLYLVNLHCPVCNGQGQCSHDGALDALRESLLDSGVRIGADAIAARSAVEVLGDAPEAGEQEQVAEGFWKLQESRGLYGVRHNAIRISSEGLLYHTFDLPTEAPEGKYRITTHFLRGNTLMAVARNDLFVRQSGLVNWLSRLSERHAMAYGVFTVAIALAAGFLAGTVFKRGAKH
jgi:hypothetical protein